jgi:hypothetical protein
MPEIRPLGAVIAAVILAIIPYLTFRGLVARIVKAVNRSEKYD